MKIDTRDFGKIEIDENETIEFRSAIYGFEQAKHFALLSDDSIGGVFLWLQSVEYPEVRFILVDPNVVTTPYMPQLAQQTRELLEFQEEDTPVFFAIAVIPEEFAKTTVNLKSPIVINSRTKRAAQVILDEDYPIRALLLQSEEGKTC